MRVFAATIVAVTCLLGVPALAFECGGVTGTIEKAICSDPAAKAADDAMVAAFAGVKARSSEADSAMLLADQRVWLKERNGQCGGRDAAPCLRRLDDERTAYLQARPKAGPGTPQPLVPLIVSVKNSKTTYAVTVRLFRFAKPQTPAEVQSNDLMATLVRETETLDEAGGADMSMFYAERLGNMAYASDRLLSVVVDSSDNTGGAHPSSASQTVNMDMRTGQRLSIDDLLAADKRADVVALCGAQVARQWRDKQREQGEAPDSKEARDEVATWAKDSADGLRQTTTDLANWTFGPNKAAVTYNAYVVGPYAMGAFTCDIANDQLRRLAKPGFPLP